MLQHYFSIWSWSSCGIANGHSMRPCQSSSSCSRVWILLYAIKCYWLLSVRRCLCRSRNANIPPFHRAQSRPTPGRNIGDAWKCSVSARAFRRIFDSELGQCNTILIGRSTSTFERCPCLFVLRDRGHAQTICIWKLNSAGSRFDVLD